MRLFSFPRGPVAATLVLFAAGPVAASDPLVLAIKPVADQCETVLRRQQQSRIGIDTVAAVEKTDTSSGPETSSGPGIRAALELELKARKFEVNAAAAVRVSIRYEGKEGPHPDFPSVPVLQVTLNVTFKNNGQVLDEKPIPIPVGNQEAARIIMGLSNEFVPNKSKPRVEEQLLVSFQKPKAALKQTVVLAAENSPYGVEVVVNGKAVNPVDRNGRAFTPVARNEEYELRLVNYSPNEVAARVRIDGLSVFHFSDLRQPDLHKNGTDPNPLRLLPLYDVIMIPAARTENNNLVPGTADVPGWHITNGKVLAFKVTDYANTEAAKLGQEGGQVGTISVTFAACWKEGEAPPKDEPKVARDVGDDGTARGQSKDVNVVAEVRTIGAVRASVSVRYTLPK